ncbi:cystathionine beta-lyase [Cereibacter sp. SYSU M97828]|nr:cystathionine beta-lyase [Cereibacter flavus]
MNWNTLAVTAGRDALRQGGAVSPPVDRAATRIFADLDAIEEAHASGKLSAFLGSRTPDQTADAIALLEGSDCEAIITSSGMSALTATFLATLSAGDHLLLPDSVFGPTRDVASGLLARLGIESSYYHPLASEESFRTGLRPNTKLVLTESPGSNTFEIQDIPMIVGASHAAGALVAIDNSWATPILFRPLAFGVDISVCAATKYLAGHSDTILGTVAARPELAAKLRTTLRQMGDTPGPDDAWLLARGLRTLPLRMRQHDASARIVAEALRQFPQVRQVLHPAFADVPGHDNWKRDFYGASGLFGVLLDPMDRNQISAFLGKLDLFQLGFSWGGFESLVLPISLGTSRKILGQPEGTLLRLHVGLEDPEDLISDLQRAFAIFQSKSPELERVT